jgi:hypothetical protein
MGLAKFWLKHGPGSPGSVTKVMARSYSIVKRNSPTHTHEQILQQALSFRYAIARVASSDLQNQMLVAAVSDRSLSKRDTFTKLIFEILQLENPKAFPLPREVMELAVEVIHETLDKQLAPGSLD